MTPDRRRALGPRKWFAGAVSALILGFQVLAIQPGGRFAGTWYWPFTNYPMYASAHHEGDIVTVRRLVGVSCGSAETRELTYRDLRALSDWFKFQLDRIASGGGADGDRKRRRGVAAITERVRLYLAGEVCQVELWQKAMRLSRDLSGAASVPSVLVHRWTVADVSAEGAAGNGPVREAS